MQRGNRAPVYIAFRIKTPVRGNKNHRSERREIRCELEKQRLIPAHSMYAWTKDWNNAWRFVSIRNAWSADEIMFSMDTILALDMLDDAKRLSRRCMKVLPVASTRFEQSLLIEALASFFARTHAWDKANTLWQQAPLDQPFRRNALSGVAELHRRMRGRSLECLTAQQPSHECHSEQSRGIPWHSPQVISRGVSTSLDTTAHMKFTIGRRALEKLLKAVASRPGETEPIAEQDTVVLSACTGPCLSSAKATSQESRHSSSRTVR